MISVLICESVLGTAMAMPSPKYLGSRYGPPRNSQQRFEERQEEMFPRAQREELIELLDRYKEANHARAATIMAAPHDPRRAAEQRTRKQKNKRKAASAARKANRHKHK